MIARRIIWIGEETDKLVREVRAMLLAKGAVVDVSELLREAMRTPIEEVFEEAPSERRRAISVDYAVHRRLRDLRMELSLKTGRTLTYDQVIRLILYGLKKKLEEDDGGK